jgi:pimeloyl-ACP methyl ester carboxylesterase
MRVLMVVLICGSLCGGADSRFAQVGNLRLQYTDWGGRGEVLLFIPGGCDTAFVFGDIAPKLAGRFRVLGLTPRGCGASERPDSGYGMTSQVSDILGFLDALGIERATLIGHSSGGGKITKFAQSNPERVGRLIYLDTVYRYVAPGLEEKMDAAIAKATTDTPPDSLERRKRRFRMWELGAWSAAIEQHFEETFKAGPARNLWQEVNRDMEAGVYFDTRIAHPALMIFAMDTDRDRARQLGPEVARELKPLIDATERERRREIRSFRANGKHVRIVEMRHTAHYCFVERPDAVVRAMEAFLSPAAYNPLAR